MIRAGRFVVKSVVAFVALAGLFAVAPLVAGAQEAAPELDPGTAASGVALLVGGALLLIERYRRRR